MTAYLDRVSRLSEGQPSLRVRTRSRFEPVPPDAEPPWERAAEAAPPPFAGAGTETAGAHGTAGPGPRAAVRAGQGLVAATPAGPAQTVRAYRARADDTTGDEGAGQDNSPPSFQDGTPAPHDRSSVLAPITAKTDEESLGVRLGRQRLRADRAAAAWSPMVGGLLGAGGSSGAVGMPGAGGPLNVGGTPGAGPVGAPAAGSAWPDLLPAPDDAGPWADAGQPVRGEAGQPVRGEAGQAAYRRGQAAYRRLWSDRTVGGEPDSRRSFTPAFPAEAADYTGDGAVPPTSTRRSGRTGLAAADAEPDQVTVTIGRIDVRVGPPEPAAPGPGRSAPGGQPTAGPRPGRLEDYLRARAAGRIG